MSAVEVLSAWEKIQAQAEKENDAHWGSFFACRDELERVKRHFGVRAALDFAWAEHDIPPLAFLVEFNLLDQGEKFGVFAL